MGTNDIVYLFYRRVNMKIFQQTTDLPSSRNVKRYSLDLESGKICTCHGTLEMVRLM
jgi:hypothetical protein